MSKYATHDGRSVDYSGKVTIIHDDWRIVFAEEGDGLVHEGDMLMTYDGVFKHVEDGRVTNALSEVGANINSKICAIRKIEKVAAVEPVTKRMKKKEFLSELSGLHS